MLDYDCSHAGALNGLPGPTHQWFTGFTHSHSLVTENHTGSHAVRLYSGHHVPRLLQASSEKRYVGRFPRKCSLHPTSGK